MSDFFETISYGVNKTFDHENAYVLVYGKLFLDPEKLREAAHQMLKHASFLELYNDNIQKGKSSNDDVLPEPPA